MKKIIVTIILVSALSLLHANLPEHESYMAGGVGGFTVGMVMPDMDNINQVIKDNTGKEVKIPMLSTGGGGFGLIGRLVMGGSGGGCSQRINGDSVQIDINYGYGFFEPGYALIATKRFQLHLIAGFGGSGGTIFIKPGDYGNVSLDSILKNPRTSSQIEFGSVSVLPSIRMMVSFGFLNLGLKAGYLYNFNPKWELKGGGLLSDSPDDNFSGFTASLSILFGGWEKD